MASYTRRVLGTAAAELSVAASRTFGTPFDLRALEELLDAMLRGETTLLPRPKLDDESRRAVDLRRFRLQAERAAAQTAYYGDLFGRLAVDPSRLTWQEIAELPLTPKEALRDRPYDFVCRDASPSFRTTTTGTTGPPTSVCFSRHEMETYILLGAIGNLAIRDILPEDVVLLSSSSRALLGNLNGIGLCDRIGALWFSGGLVEPELTLAMLTEEHHVPGKHSRVSVWAPYPSYLGEVVEVGLAAGYGPSDFGVRRIDLGAEIYTEGLLERTRKLFLEDVGFARGYGMTETWPLGAEMCDDGHLHFPSAQAYVEIRALDGGAVAPGEPGTVVATPLPPYRETTLVIQYDTQDVVRALTELPTCAASELMAVSGIQGKLALSVQYENGWVFPAEVREALEAVDAVPLPARCGFWAVDGGVAVEVLVRRETAAARREIAESLDARGVPVRELHLRTDRSELERPLPLRCDLREASFKPPVRARAEALT
jgi:phenylacetate-coenzyme A ligase PaaK-like adenylate-forming protein